MLLLTSLVAMFAVHDCGFELIHQTPYSPDLAASDYFLFPNLRKHLAGKRYKSDDDVISAVEDFFESQEENFYVTGKLLCHSTDGRSVWTAEEIMLRNKNLLCSNLNTLCLSGCELLSLLSNVCDMSV